MSTYKINQYMVLGSLNPFLCAYIAMAPNGAWYQYHHMYSSSTMDLLLSLAVYEYIMLFILVKKKRYFIKYL